MPAPSLTAHGCCHFGEKRHTKRCHMAAREAAAIFTQSKPRCCSKAQRINNPESPLLLQPGGLRNELTALGFPGKNPLGSLPGVSSGLQPCPRNPWAQALPTCCQESLKRGIKCACPSHSSLQRGPGLRQAGERTGQFSTVCSMRVSSCPEGMEKALGCCWAALLTPVVYLSRCYLGTQLM